VGVADKLNTRLHQELKAYVAWLPVANRFAVGDYGLIAHGIFQPLGRVEEFGVVVPPPTDSPGASVNFSSAGTTLTRAVAGATVDAFPDEPIDAKLSVEFSDAESYLLRAAMITTQEMTNVAAVATQLASAKGWRRAYKVVWGTITGQNCTVVTSRKGSAKLDVSGKANVLRQLDLGAASADFSVSGERDVGYSSLGQSGVLGLRLFKLRSIGASPGFMGEDADQAFAPDGGEVDADLGAELEDDI
jgi:hypothetical protein